MKVRLKNAPIFVRSLVFKVIFTMVKFRYDRCYRYYCRRGTLLQVAHRGEYKVPYTLYNLGLGPQPVKMGGMMILHLVNVEVKGFYTL